MFGRSNDGGSARGRGAGRKGDMRLGSGGGRGRPVGQPRGRMFMLAVGSFGLLLGAISFFVGYRANKVIPGRSYYNLYANAANAQNLSSSTEVRMDGVNIGQVLDPEVKDGKAHFKLQLAAKYKPFKSDTKVRIRLRSAVGVRYVQLIPGTKGTPLANNATLPASASNSPIALDDVLGTFDPTTRARTETLLQGLGGGFAGRGLDTNETIKNAPAFLTTLGGVSSAITSRPNSIMSKFISASGNAADTFDPIRGDIVRGFKPESKALKIFQDNKSGVQSTFKTGGPALNTLQQDLPRVSGLVDAAAGLARDGAPTLRVAPASLKTTTNFLKTSQQPLQNIKSTLGLAQNAVSPTLGALHTLNPMLAPVEQALNSVEPTVQYAGPRACDIGPGFTQWASFMKWGDTYDHFIRFVFDAPRADQPAGSFPNQKNPPLSALTNSPPLSRPYTDANACASGNDRYGDGGRLTVQEDMKGETYTTDHHPGQG